MAYIDKDKLLQDISETVIFSVRPDRPSAELRGARKIVDRIRTAPTVDVVEVVRCCECKKSGVLEHNGKMFCKEPMGCLGCVPTKPDNFCSYGERRDTE